MDGEGVSIGVEEAILEVSLALIGLMSLNASARAASFSLLLGGLDSTNIFICIVPRNG